MILQAFGPEHGLRLRPVEAADAEFILSLRLDPALSRFIGETSSEIFEQRRWIESQRARPGDAYFICETPRRPHGTIGLYGIADGRAEWGRWLISPGSMASAGSAYLLYRLAFDELKLDSVFCRTIEANERVLGFHDRCGLRRTGFDRNPVTIGGREHRLIMHELARERWPAVRSVLEPLASAAARFLTGAVA